MKNVYQLAAEFRADLLARDALARDQLLTAYHQSLRAIEQQITKVAVQIVNLKDNGINKGLFIEQRRLYDLQAQVKGSISNLGHMAAQIATNNQQIAVSSATQQASMLLEAQARKLADPVKIELLGNFSRFPTEAIQQLAGVVRGNPIHEVFDSIAKDLGHTTADKIKSALVKGVALGDNPDKIVKAVVKEANAQNGNSQRPPIVVRRLHSAVRNETFRAYREATRQVYKQSRVATGWRWVSRQSPTTCVICWSQDGKTFGLNTAFASHVNCRCVSVPVLDDEEDYKTGPDRFDDLETGVQRSILGDKAYAAFAAGKVELDDFVQETSSRKWGPGLQRKSLDDLLGEKKEAA